MDFKKLFKIFSIFFKVGIFTIGGGLVMIPVMHREFVEKQKWVSNEKMLDIFTVAQAFPGVIAVNSSVYIGYEISGIGGAVAAAVGVTLPSFLCILTIFFSLSSIGDSVYLAKFYMGVRASVVALILLAAVKLGKSAVKDVFALLLALFGIAAMIIFKLPVFVIILLSGFGGYIYYCRYPKLAERRGKAASNTDEQQKGGQS